MVLKANEVLEKKVHAWLSAHQDEARDLGAKIVFEINGSSGGRWLLDATTSPPSFQKDAQTSGATTIRMNEDIFLQLNDGTLSPEGAFLSGQVQVEGSLGLAIKLGGLLT